MFKKTRFQKLVIDDYVAHVIASPFVVVYFVSFYAQRMVRVARQGERATNPREQASFTAELWPRATVSCLAEGT